MISQKSRQILRDASYYFPTLKYYENLIYGLNKVAPNIAKTIDDNLPFSHLGDMTKSDRYIKRRTSFKKLTHTLKESSVIHLVRW